jgi:beta-xylosidase
LSFKHSLTKLCEPDGTEARVAAQGGLFAPTMRYHEGTFYIVCTNVVHRRYLPLEENEHQNFIISTTDIWADEWSDPVFYDFFGIDTSLFWDDDGRVYLIGASGPPPATKIRQFEIDLKTGEKLSETKLLWEGITKVWPEGPHMYKKDGWYYLLIAEGGCFEGHHVNMARSRDIWGPYEVNPANPVLEKTDPAGDIQYTGHGDLFQHPSGQWYFVCLGVRKRDGRFIMGRESVLTTATWPEGEYPVIDPAQLDVPLPIEGNTTTPSPEWPTGRRKPGRPDVAFVRIRVPVEENYEYDGNNVTLTSSRVDMSQGKEPVTFTGKRQRRLDGSASATLEPLSPSAVKDSGLRTGLCYYKDEHRFVRAFLDIECQEMVLEIINKARSIAWRTSQDVGALGTSGARVTFGVDHTEVEFVFWYSVEAADHGAPTKTELGRIDTRDMSGHDFVGPIIGVYAVSDKEVTVRYSDLVVEGM